MCEWKIDDSQQRVEGVVCGSEVDMGISKLTSAKLVPFYGGLVGAATAVGVPEEQRKEDEE